MDLWSRDTEITTRIDVEGQLHLVEIGTTSR